VRNDPEYAQSTLGWRPTYHKFDGGEHLSALLGNEHLPFAPAPRYQMQGVQGGKHLPAPAREE
jgi:hypothetical protein